jgi:hypothetical protein
VKIEQISAKCDRNTAGRSLMMYESALYAFFCADGVGMLMAIVAALSKGSIALSDMPGAMHRARSRYLQNSASEWPSMVLPGACMVRATVRKLAML